MWEKGANAGIQHFLLFLHFSRDSSSGSLKLGGTGVNPVFIVHDRYNFVTKILFLFSK